MTISIHQQVDFLWKKLGYNVAKTESPSLKDATNESISSSPFIPGDKIWTQSDLIPQIAPTGSGAIISSHNDIIGTTVACLMDVTSSPNRTWVTGFTDWVPTTFGSTYQIKVYLAPVNCPNPQVVGHQLFAMGSNQNDEWYFDHESGVLNFIGDNLPNLNFTGKILYIAGCRYIGRKGVNSMASGSFGNITISGDIIQSTNDIILTAANNRIFASNAIIGNVGYPVLPQDVATMQYVVDNLGSVSANAIHQADSSVTVTDPGVNGTIVVKADNTQIASFTSTTATISSLSITGSTISSVDDIAVNLDTSRLMSINATTAIKVPTGSMIERPVVAGAGYIRFNTSTGILEVFNGATWISTQAQLERQTIVGDGINSEFLLNKEANAEELFVTINGISQTPVIAYYTFGSTIKFEGIPEVTDVIEIRYMSQSIVAMTTRPNTEIVKLTNIAVDTTPVTLDQFNVGSYTSAKYTIQVSDSSGNTQLTEILAVHDGVTNAQLKIIQTTMTGGTLVVSYAASITAGMFSLTATSSEINTLLRMQKVYFL